MSPTYELALQTGEVASKMSQFATDLTLRFAVRGEEIARGSNITDHIIIGTPGKVSWNEIALRASQLQSKIVFLGIGLGLKVQILRPEENQGLRFGRGGCYDCHARSSRSIDSDSETTLKRLSNPTLFGHVRFDRHGFRREYCSKSRCE